ncbi:hypothetical protein [Aggregatibacter sp. 2125159857]|uniref:hypothetical protein n=1 Tax=Aggregatibacter sp. 2125159857 TaxID=2820817 RepID=UPI001ADF0E58|nr:hypothetical protein [Aggregatibacter sp. 2125159857]QTO00878.1 hypothetical protein J5X96_06405 [Aggregatibacter sp. 2125159857]
MAEVEDQQYKLRGHMVQRRTHQEIATEAVVQFSKLSQIEQGQLNIERFIDHLAMEDIAVHILPNREWNKKHFLTKGLSIPIQGKIFIPQKLFNGAVKNNPEDWKTFFHELGHVVLRHEPIYLKADEKRAIESLDDAETQADYFALVMMKLFNLRDEPAQLELNF